MSKIIKTNDFWPYDAWRPISITLNRPKTPKNKELLSAKSIVLIMIQ